MKWIKEINKSQNPLTYQTNVFPPSSLYDRCKEPNTFLKAYNALLKGNSYLTWRDQRPLQDYLCSAPSLSPVFSVTADICGTLAACSIKTQSPGLYISLQMCTHTLLLLMFFLNLNGLKMPQDHTL